jgi:DNA-directed RNA polymerase specialized sigma24 family protein
MNPGSEEASWHETWMLYKEHAPALLQMARAICRNDPRLGLADAEDLLHSFVVDRLTRVARASQTLKEEDRRRYVRAAFRNFLRSAGRNQALRAAALEQVSRELSRADPEQPADAELEQHGFAQGLHPAIADLPLDLARPAALYLGLTGPPQSIREIAASLGLTRYLARLTIVNGLVAIAARLRARALLSDREMEAARLVLLEGNDLEGAAQSLGLTRQQVSAALARARDALAARVTRDGRRRRHD